MVFGGGILGGARKIWRNPSLNSTTVLFDTIVSESNALVVLGVDKIKQCQLF